MKVVVNEKLYISIKNHKLYECDKKECHNFTSRNVMLHDAYCYVIYTYLL